MTEDDVKKRAKALIADLEEALNVSDIAAVDWGEQIEIEIGTVERHLRAYGEKLERERDEARAILRDIIHSHTTITDGLMIRVVVDATVMDRAIRALEERPAGNDDGPL